jgi:hypothetical protein
MTDDGCVYVLNLRTRLHISNKYLDNVNNIMMIRYSLRELSLNNFPANKGCISSGIGTRVLTLLKTMIFVFKIKKFRFSLPFSVIEG